MPFTLPMIDVNARWTGPLACLDDAAAEAAGDAWGDVVAAYVQTGRPDGLSSEGCMVTLRPLSAAEDDACEAAAGAPVPLAGFVYDRLRRDGVDLADGEAVARAVASLPDADRKALHDHDTRLHRLRWERVNRALVAADFAPEGEAPADALARVAGPLRGYVVQELAAHLDRLTMLGAEGKAPAGAQ